MLFEALRVRELEEFFAVLQARIVGADSLEDLLVRTVVGATEELRADDHLALMLASEPGTMLGQLTVEGLPRIIRFATALLAPLAEPYLEDRRAARALIDVLARLTISYFLVAQRLRRPRRRGLGPGVPRPPAPPVHDHHHRHPLTALPRNPPCPSRTATTTRSSAAPSSTTSKPSWRSPTPTSTRSSTP